MHLPLLLERNCEYNDVGRCGETIVTKVLQFWEAHNGNKGCDLMGVYFTLVNEMKTSFVEIAEGINHIPTLNISLWLQHGQLRGHDKQEQKCLLGMFFESLSLLKISHTHIRASTVNGIDGTDSLNKWSHSPTTNVS
ncbi:hypothetical protein YC2023_037548 [Brassica napus]